MKQNNNSLLQGITVLDLTRLLPGPYCTQQLAQLGATVIKIEEPNGGDYARTLAPELFEVVNQGKQSVTLDLRKQTDVEQFQQMVKTADVVVESFRPGVMDKLGCGYKALNAINPKLVYAAITGYGQTGPYADRAGHDMNYLATAGVLDQIGQAGAAPSLSNVQIADLAGGAMNAAIGILAAVIGAQKTGLGEFVDVSMTDGAFAMNTVALAAINKTGNSPKRGADMLSGALPNYRIYKCRDGKYLAVGALEPQFFMRVLAGVWDSVPAALRKPIQQLAPAKKATSNTGKQTNSGNQSLSRITAIPNDPRKAQLLLTPAHWALSAAFKTKTRDQWDKWFADKDACVSAILTPAEALDHELFKARNMVNKNGNIRVFNSPIKFNQTLATPSKSPTLGAHNT